MKQAKNKGKWVIMEEAMKQDPIYAYMSSLKSDRHASDHAKQKTGSSTAPTGKSQYSAAGQSLWCTFWREFCLENQPQERCYIPGDGRNVVDRHWVNFADNLPDGAQVLDLGCGAGIVGSTLLRSRKDLHVTGVDWANVPMMNQANLKIHPWVSMEDMPFGENCFDAAVSLFGIEYGDVANTVQELQRVLKAGAQFSFLVHHRESETVQEGGVRRRTLKELISGKMKAAFLNGNVTALDQQRRSLTQQFPNMPIINLIGDYFHRNIHFTRAERQVLWQKQADGFDPEIALLMHLERAAKSALEMGSWLPSLLSAMSMINISVLRRNSGQPIAWHVNGIK
jgi:SAM-dependent methyltransferase